MFNLFRSRDKAVRLLLTGLLVVVALSMVTYLIPNTGSGMSGDTGDTTVVAQVGKDQITTQEVSKVIQNMTRNRQLPPELLAVYVPQIVNQMIDERMMAYEADRLGIKVSPEETDSAIIDQLPPELIKDGKVDGATLNAVLQQQGVTMSQMKTATARQLLVARLEQIISAGVVVSPRDIENEFHRKNDKVNLQYAVLAPGNYQGEAEPTEAEVKAYYDSHKSDFRIPEKRSLAIVLLDPQKIGAQNVPTDAQLQKEYDSRKNDFQVPERVKVRHILLKADATNDAQVKPKAEALLKQIQAGGDFAKLAKENSQDPGSGAQGGELGWIVKGQTVPEFEKSAFSLGVGQTSGLVKTTYGYHILQVEAHEQPHFQPFEEVKGQLLADYQKRQGAERMQSLSDQVLAGLRKDPNHIDQLGQSLGLTVLHADHIQPGDPIPGVGISKDFDDAVAGLRKGEFTSGPVSLQNGMAAIAEVTDLQPAHPASFEEAKADARGKAAKEKLNKLLFDKAKELIAKANAMGGDLEKAAKEMKIDLKTSGDVDRQGAIESVGTASTIPDAFTRPVGTILGPFGVTGGQFVGKIISKTPANMSELPAQTATIRDELTKQRQRDRAQIFQEGLKTRLIADGKVKIHQDVINRIVQSYNQRG